MALCEHWLDDPGARITVRRLREYLIMPEALNTIDHYVILHASLFEDQVQVLLRALKKSALNQSGAQPIQIGGKSINVIYFDPDHYAKLLRQRRVGEIRPLLTPAGLALADFVADF